MWISLLFLGCATSGGDTSDTSSDTSADTSSDTSSDTASCSELSSGTDWAWTGECPQMPTPCDIVVTGCSLTIDYAADGGMTMGMPYAGTIEGDTVTFADDNGVTGCVGTILDADHVEGTCGDGCTFELAR